MKIRKIVICLLVAVIQFLTACSSNTDSAVSAQRPQVDLEKYMGKWYEIARYENWFQKGKTKAFAEYSLRPNGKVDIKNSAYDVNGNLTSATAVGFVPNPKDNSRLRISFFRPFYSDYLILDVAPDYSWALVGGESKDYLWILARTEDIPKPTLEHILTRATALGYDTSKLIYDE